MNNILKEIRNEVNFYFIRHGQSHHNANHIVAGRMETPLTELGKEQAKKTGEYLKGVENISVFLHSPIGRAKNTALLIKDIYAQNNKEPQMESCNDIVEIDAGIFEDKKIVDIEIENPTLFAQFKEHSWEVVPKAEKIEELIARTKKMWERLVSLANAGHTNIAIVSHGGIMQWIFKTSLGFTGEHVSSWAPIVKVSNCGIYCLKIEKTVDNKEQAQSGHAIWTHLNFLAYDVQ